MDNLKILELSNKTEFVKRIKVAYILAATNIVGENPAAYTAIQATKRHNLATAILNDPSKYQRKFALVLAVQPGLNDKYDPETLDYIGTNQDADIAFTINSIWDDMSGVSYADKQSE
jgi:hypothetical protein